MNDYAPLTDKEKALFWRYKEVWQERLGLQEWRVMPSNKEPRNAMAQMSNWDETQRQVSMRIGARWSPSERAQKDIERTVLHELLHVLLFDLAHTAINLGADVDAVTANEHRVINVLERLLPAVKL